MKKILTLEQKIGQLLIIGFQGTGPQDQGVKKILEDIKLSRIGGIIPYSYNIIDGEQITMLNRLCLEKAKECEFPPVFITIDQEGGKVQRLSKDKGFIGFPSPEEMIGKEMSDIKALYCQMARELKEHFFNWDFAPCVDTNPKGYKCPILGELGRLYGDNTAAVVKYAGMMVDVFHEEGLLNCIKHFPGHGSAKKDSHQGFVDVTDVWQEEEMEPFFQLAQKGKVDAVMTAHVFNEHLDKEYPATLSKGTLKKLRHAGYNGVIISDDLHMSAIQEKFGFEEAAVKALQAGNDMVIYSNNKMAAASIKDFEPDPELPEKFIRVILKAVKAKELSEKQIDMAFERVMKLKAKIS
jgi:beta-N-acetylhexosaminidase